MINALLQRDEVTWSSKEDQSLKVLSARSAIGYCNIARLRAEKAAQSSEGDSGCRVEMLWEPGGTLLAFHKLSFRLTAFQVLL